MFTVALFIIAKTKMSLCPPVGKLVNKVINSYHRRYYSEIKNNGLLIHIDDFHKHYAE